jgi:hypothetical protein
LRPSEPGEQPSPDRFDHLLHLRVSIFPTAPGQQYR